MPRLRKIQYEKYKDLKSDSDDEFNSPIDSFKQEKIITTFKTKMDLKNSKQAKIMFRCYLILLFFINMILITIPYYRKGINVIFSALGCLMLFSPSILAYSNIYPLDDDSKVSIASNRNFVLYSLLFYSLVTVIKFIWFRINTRADLIYTIPILFGICILDIDRNNGQLSQAILELEKYKYDYKEA